MLISSALGLVVMGGGLAVWWWSSAGYVSTEDARIQADMVAVSAQIAGKIEELAKGEGDGVSPGEVVARLETREIEIQINQAAAEVDRVQSRLLEGRQEIDFHMERQKGEVPQAEAIVQGYRHNAEDAQAHAEKAREDWRRGRELFERRLISAQELAQAETRSEERRVGKECRL